MELTWAIALCSIIILSLASLVLNGRNSRLPPGPPGWPVFGHIFSLGRMPHRTLAGLGKQYGPVFWLRLGSVNTMVISTAKASAELFKNHDQSFANRNVPAIALSHDYYKGSLVLAPCGSYWRCLRRLCSVEMLVARRINETVHVRRKCVDDMLSWIEMEARAQEARAIHVARFVFLGSFNMVGNLVLSRYLADPFSKEGSDFFSSMTEFVKLTGEPNLADLFPWLRRFDLQGLRRKMDRELGIILSITSGFMKERIKELEAQGGEMRKKDFLDVLLNHGGSENDELSKMTGAQISIFLLEMFLAGTETSSSTIEWAMTELLRHPKSMIKLKAELLEFVGPKKKVDESDIDRLVYLQAVIKETLRLHPPVPLLVPRKSTKDTEFMGYVVPKDTQVFVNAWAIGRDPEYWAEPDLFKPERFLGSKTDYKGQHFEFIPFGAGRRICVGLLLAHRVLHLMLGSLIHEFDWELEHHVDRETMDMRDKIGTTVSKLVPLEAIPKKRMIK